MQKRTLLVKALAITSALTIVATVLWPHVVATVALLAQLAAAVCFCTLYVRVKDGYLLWQHGPGWISGKVALRQIQKTRVVVNRRGRPALEIMHSNGKRLLLSTPRAEELRQLIDSAPERHSRGTSC